MLDEMAKQSIYNVLLEECKGLKKRGKDGDLKVGHQNSYLHTNRGKDSEAIVPTLR